VGALQAAGLNGAQLLVRGVGSGDAAGLAETIARLRDNGARGLVLSPPYAEMLKSLGADADPALPVAVVAAGAPMPGTLTVRVDDRLAMQRLATHLLDQGHRRIGFITGPDGHTSSAARLAGYRDALAAFGLAADERLIMPGDFRFDSAMPAARALLESAAPPSAIMASNDDMAAAVIAVAAQMGLPVPERLAVTGFNNDAIAQTIWPTLTTVHQPVQAMAEQALTLLVRRMRGQVVAEDHVVDFALMARASTASRRPAGA
jgi:LacI family transcriptional regulator